MSVQFVFTNIAHVCSQLENVNGNENKSINYFIRSFFSLAFTVVDCSSNWLFEKIKWRWNCFWVTQIVMTWSIFLKFHRMLRGHFFRRDNHSEHCCSSIPLTINYVYRFIELSSFHGMLHMTSFNFIVWKKTEYFIHRSKTVNSISLATKKHRKQN